MPAHISGEPHADPDTHKGAVEGDRPSDPEQHFNPNAPALDENGLPDDCDRIAQDTIGATVDDTQG